MLFGFRENSGFSVVPKNVIYAHLADVCQINEVVDRSFDLPRFIAADLLLGDPELLSELGLGHARLADINNIWV